MRCARPDLADVAQGPAGEGYPLRDDAFSGPPPEVDAPTELAPTETIAVEPVDPAAPPGRRFPSALLAVLALVLLGAAYVVTRTSSSRHPLGGPARAAASPSASTPVPTPPLSTAPPTTSPAAATAAPPPKVGIPRVVGDSLPTAIAALKQAGLVALVSHVPSSLPSGQVVGQNPGAGATERKGGKVRVEVSLQRPVVVPNVTGIRLLYARRRLTADDLLVSVRYVPSTQPARRVVAQFPPAGKKVRRGAHVLVNVSNGASKASGSAAATVPDVVGEDEATATSDLEEAGFSVEPVDSPTSDPGQDGLVVDQDPSGGTRTSDSSHVTIYVGRYSGG